MPEALPIAEALRLIRARHGLTQTALSRLEGAPDFRTLSHWETGRKLPTLRLLHRFLTALGLDFRDLQNALDQLAGRVGGSLDSRLSAIERQVVEVVGQVDRTVESLVGFERRVSGGADELGQRVERLEALVGRLRESAPRKPKT